MTTPKLPSPLLVFVQLAGWGALVALLQALLLLPIRPPSTIFALPTVVIALVSAAFVVLRTSSLYRSARRAADGDDAPPPSRSALADAVRGPYRAAEAFVIAEAAIVVVGAIAYGGSLDPIVFITPVAGTAFALAPAYAVGFRRFLRPWIVAFPPGEVAAVPSRPVSRRAAMAAASSVLGIGLLGTAIGALADETRVAALVVGGSVTVGVAVVAAVVSSRLSRRLMVDVQRLRLSLTQASDRSKNHTEDWVDETADPQVVALARLVERASTSMSRIADDEERTKSSIEESQRNKTVFMASMSHDLRSPLNSIMGFSELLLSGIGGDLTKEQRESVSVIQRSGSELLELLNDIIDSARLEAGRLPLRQEWTPTVELLTEAVQKGRELVQLRTGTGAGFTIEEEVEPGLPPVHVDAHRIVQAILCIFRHATMVTEGGAIRLSAKAHDRDVRVSITDAGLAFMDEDRERVFQAFRAMTSASGRRIGGMGLSLSLARSLVRAHGGDIHYDPSGEGTTFHVNIPARRSHRSDPDRREARSEPGRSGQ